MLKVGDSAGTQDTGHWWNGPVNHLCGRRDRNFVVCYVKVPFDFKDKPVFFFRGSPRYEGGADSDKT